MSRDHVENADPYAPPPRYKNRSGAMVRVVILGALLAAAGWGYMEFSKGGPGLVAVAPSEEQTVADTGFDNPIPAPPPAAAPATTETGATPEPPPG